MFCMSWQHSCCKMKFCMVVITHFGVCVVTVNSFVFHRMWITSGESAVKWAAGARTLLIKWLINTTRWIPILPKTARRDSLQQGTSNELRLFWLTKISQLCLIYPCLVKQRHMVHCGIIRNKYTLWKIYIYIFLSLLTCYEYSKTCGILANIYIVLQNRENASENVVCKMAIISCRLSSSDECSRNFHPCFSWISGAPFTKMD